MIGELVDACHMRGLRFTLYYNHSGGSGDNPAWERSVCDHVADKSRLAEKLRASLGGFGARYGSRLDGW